MVFNDLTDGQLPDTGGGYAAAGVEVFLSRQADDTNGYQRQEYDHHPPEADRAGSGTVGLFRFVRLMAHGEFYKKPPDPCQRKKVAIYPIDS